MYIKLNSINSNRYYNNDNFIILSEVVDSKISYETPVLVRSIEELNIWFGKDFSDYSYLSSLLQSGISLYLTKPMNNKINRESDSFIDLSKFITDNKLYRYISELPLEGNFGKLYEVISDTGVNKTEDGIPYDNYIWYMNEYVDISLLPQNIDPIKNSTSLNNRDVLSINYLPKTNINIPKYCYPKYIQDVINPIYKEGINTIKNNIEDWDVTSDRINKGYSTMSLSLEFSDNFLNGSTKESPYIIIEDVNNKNYLVYFDNGTGIPKSVNKKYYTYFSEMSGLVENSIKLNLLSDNNLNIKNLVDIFKKLGYKLIDTKDTKTYTFVIDSLINYTNFQTLPGLKITPNKDSTYNIIHNVFKNYESIRFISKTIGSDENINSKIAIDIISLSETKYRVSISRFDYVEVFEGELDKDLENLISKESKLVRCEIINSNNKIPCGRWIMERSIPEKYTTEMYWKAVDNIYNPFGDSVYFDYFLIPDRTKFFKDDLTNESNYIKLLNYSINNMSQVIIQNNYFNYKIVEYEKLPKTLEKEKIYKIDNNYYIKVYDNIIKLNSIDDIINYSGDFIYNYIKDENNYFLYFIGDFNNDYPSYCAYLTRIIFNESGLRDNNISYSGMTINRDFYTRSEVEDVLEKYKCNYLIANNYMYYYNKYQDGENYNTSGLMRFCIGKIGRELEKNKWLILSQNITTTDNIEKNTIKILNRVKDSFDIIENINISEINTDTINNKVDLYIESEMNNQVDKDINLNITLNFNK